MKKLSRERVEIVFASNLKQLNKDLDKTIKKLERIEVLQKKTGKK